MPSPKEGQFNDSQVIFRKGNPNDDRELRRRSAEALANTHAQSDDEKRKTGDLFYPENLHITGGDTSSVTNTYYDAKKGKRVTQRITDVPVSGRANAKSAQVKKMNAETTKRLGAGVIKAGKLRQGKGK